MLREPPAGRRLVLLAALRRPRRALIPLVPIVLATGWSALLVYLLRIPLNPMSATLGTLVIAITTEFSVLLSERVRRQCATGCRSSGADRRRLPHHRGRRADLGVTAIAGFGVLVVSNITMLRDFGLLTLVDLTVSLAGVMLVLPAVLGDRLRPAPKTEPSNAERQRRGQSSQPSAMIDTRRYQWMIGGIRAAAGGRLLGLPLYATASTPDPGVRAGQRLHHFVAPLATSDLNAPANVSPRCDPARPAGAD